MGKRMKMRCGNDDSFISQLPDEILIIILSLLTVKEAGRTMVLSLRWVDLWKHISRLDFESPTALERIRPRPDFKFIMKPERRNYVEWMNKILKSNKAPVIKEFNVCYSFGKKHSSSIRKWVNYAFSRSVEKLVLNLLPVFEVPPELQCNFPKQLLKATFKPLKMLYLKAVDVSEEDLGSFLNNCPFLEKMVVWYSSTLLNFEISGFSLKLKHLEICYCYYLESLIVCNTKLVSLTVAHYVNICSFRGNNPVLLLENVPSLVDVNITPISVHGVLSLLSCCLLQLVALNVTLCIGKQEEMRELLNLPILTKLKKLVLGFYQGAAIQDYLKFDYLRIAPCLQEFALEVNSMQGSFISQLYWQVHPQPARFLTPRTKNEVTRAEISPLQFLKVVKVSGFLGRKSELDFLRYFVDYAVALERIIIEPFNKFYGGPPMVAELQKHHVRDLAKQFEAEVPQHIQLLIL